MFGLKSLSAQKVDKKQGVRLKNPTPLQIGDPNGTRTHVARMKILSPNH